MDIIAIIDLVALLATICALIILLIFWKSDLSLYTKMIFLILIGLHLFHNLSNFLEWSTLTNFLDPYEDFIQVLEPILWFTFFFAFLQELSKKYLRKSEKRYREAYNRAEFYKDIFVHDINNILQNILTSAEICNLYHEDPDKLKNFRNIINDIEFQVMKGARLVNNIRILSDLEEIKWRIEPIELDSILENVISKIKEEYSDRNIKIQIETQNKNSIVLADDHLVYVFKNILYNAIHHNINSNIEICIKVSQKAYQENRVIKMEFIDNGVGIDDAQKDIIFKREYKKDKSLSGQGLGLSIVKKIIDLYKGYIWVEDNVPNVPSSGSKFIILIPEVL